MKSPTESLSLNDQQTLQAQRDLGAGFVSLQRVISIQDQDALVVFKNLESEIKGQPCCFFQKSEEKNGEYVPTETLIGFGLMDRVTVTGARVKIQNGGESFQGSQNPFEVISSYLKKYHTVESNEALKPTSGFRGGAVGYFNYESVRYLEPVLKTTAGYFSTVDENASQDIEFLFFENFIVFDHLQKKIFFLSGLMADESASFEALKKIKKCFAFIEGLLKKGGSRLEIIPDAVKDDEISVDAMTSSLGRSCYIDGVAKLKRHIAKGDIFQAVLSERFEFDLTVKPIEIFETLAVLYPAPYLFYLSTGQSLFFGASPEMLLKLDRGNLETHPIAGTRPRGQNQVAEKKFEKQLLASPKENAEHLMLVDLARNDLGRVSQAGTVRVPVQMELKKFPGVMHLVSKVTGKLKENQSGINALGACFPAGTLSGAPKVKAMELISEIEKGPRGFYGGALTLAGFNGNLDSCIAIRSVEIKGKKGIIQAGAGVVADSRAEAEYEEIVHKTKALRRAVAVANKIFSQKPSKLKTKLDGHELRRSFR